jgi:uncharacterized heparinase superfamily protein
MEHRVGALPNPLDPHLATGWMKQPQVLRRTRAHIFVRVPDRLACRMPVGTRIGNRLVGARFVFGPYRQAGLRIRGLDRYTSDR